MPQSARRRKTQLASKREPEAPARRAPLSLHFFRAAFKFRAQSARELAAWVDSVQRGQIEAFAPPATPPEGADLHAPWWAALQNAGPRRARSPNGRPGPRRPADMAPMAQALAPAGLAPDWDAIFEQVSAALRRDGAPSSIIVSDERLDWCAGRLRVVHERSLRGPFAPPKRSQRWLQRASHLGSFDPRRAKRRQGKPVPAKWSEAFGGEASTFWSAGLGPRWSLFPLRLPLVQVAKELLKAMLDHGALAAFMCSSFGPHASKGLSDQAAFEATDAQALDHPRARWMLGLDEAPSPKAPPRRSL